MHRGRGERQRGEMGERKRKKEESGERRNERKKRGRDGEGWREEARESIYNDEVHVTSYFLKC